MLRRRSRSISLCLLTLSLKIFVLTSAHTSKLGINLRSLLLPSSRLRLFSQGIHYLSWNRSQQTSTSQGHRRNTSRVACLMSLIKCYLSVISWSKRRLLGLLSKLRVILGATILIVNANNWFALWARLLLTLGAIWHDLVCIGSYSWRSHYLRLLSRVVLNYILQKTKVKFMFVYSTRVFLETILNRQKNYLR